MICGQENCELGREGFNGIQEGRSSKVSMVAQTGWKTKEHVTFIYLFVFRSLGIFAYNPEIYFSSKVVPILNFRNFYNWMRSNHRNHKRVDVSPNSTSNFTIFKMSILFL